MRCHDHKFDPIPTRDYYSLAAAYNGADWSDRLIAAPEVVAVQARWEQDVKQQRGDLDGWLLEQGRTLARPELERTATYLLTAWKVRVLKRQQQNVDLAALAEQDGVQLYFLNRWLNFGHRRI